MSKVALNKEEARRDLTLRECTKILGSTIGGLAGMTDKQTLGDAIRWWEQNFDSSRVFELANQMESQMKKGVPVQA